MLNNRSIKKQQEGSNRLQWLKTAWVYMVEEKGVKTERTENPSGNHDRNRSETELFSSRVDGRGGGRAGRVGGRLRKTTSPVCEGPWRGRGTLMGAGCCCLLRLNSSYTLDTCRAESIEKNKQLMTRWTKLMLPYFTALFLHHPSISRSVGLIRWICISFYYIANPDTSNGELTTLYFRISNPNVSIQKA